MGTITIQDMTSREIHTVPATTPVLSTLNAREFGANPTTAIDENDAGYVYVGPNTAWDGLTLADVGSAAGAYVWDDDTGVWYLSTVVTAYTVTGPVRGNCGHMHTTIRGAVQCRLLDQKNVASLGGGAYSDREIKHCDGSSLTEREIEDVEAITDEMRA